MPESNAAAESLRRPTPNRFRSRSLRTAALAASVTASSTVVADHAEAAIISDTSNTYTAGQTFSLDGTVFSEIEILTRNNGGMFDLFLEAPSAMMGDSSSVEFAIFSSGGMMSVDYLDALGAADTVDAALAYTDLAYLVEDGDVNPNFAAGTTAYAGFVFDPTGTLPMYGWARIQFDASGTDLTIDQWAFDDTGAPIGVGVIPEPATALLFGLGLMGLAASGRSRRRRSMICTAGAVDGSTDREADATAL